MDPTSLLEQLSALHDDSWGWAKSCCDGDAHCAEDALQAAYGKAARGEAKFAGRSSLKTWWFGVLRLTAWEMRRKALRESSFAEQVAHEWRRWFGAPTHQSDRLEESRTLTACLSTLPQRQREVLALVFYHDLSLQEAADSLGIGLGSARTHYDRGKRRLREMLHEHPDFSTYEPAT